MALTGEDNMGEECGGRSAFAVWTPKRNSLMYRSPVSKPRTANSNVYHAIK
jgi:hypothetical protein